MYSVPLFRRGIRGYRATIDTKIKNRDRNQPDVSNLVSLISATAGGGKAARISLPRLCASVIHAEWRPKDFASVYLRFHPGSAGSATRNSNGSTVIVYSTGKILGTGSKSYSQAVFNAHACALIIGMVRKRVIRHDKITKRANRIRYVPLSRIFTFSKISISNIVGRAQVDPKTIDLCELAMFNSRNVRYTPSTFSGVRASLDKFSSQIFDTGKVVYLGLNHVHQFSESNRIVRQVISECNRMALVRGAVRYHTWIAEQDREGRVDEGTGEASGAVVPSCAVTPNKFRDRVVEYHNPTAYRHRSHAEHSRIMTGILRDNLPGIRSLCISDFKTNAHTQAHRTH